jgi:PAS domain S-box-containing protein
MTWNKLLEKQIMHHLNPNLMENEEVRRLLDAVNNSYNSYHRDGQIEVRGENEYKGNLWRFKDITLEGETQCVFQRLSLVASSNENGVLFTDLAGTITWANEGFSQLTGYSKEEVVGNTPIGLCKGPLSNKESIKEMLTLFETGRNFSVEVIHYRKDGSWFWGKVKGQSILDDNGKTIQYFAMVEDITVKKHMELEIIEAKELAEQSSRAKEIFLANMSHEIRTPMNAILGMSRQLKKTELDDQQMFYLDTIHSAADHLLVVINDILDISRIEAGRLVLETIGFSMKDVARRVHGVMYHKAEEKGLKLSFCVDDDIPTILLGDPYRLNQVLLNLVSNAVKFTARGCVKVNYNLAQSQAKEHIIRIVVTDTGIGMEEGFLNHLFGKFVQEDSAVARKYGGTGLGMSICKQLVGLMSGAIMVKSRKDVGTNVILEIPFAPGRESDKSEKEEWRCDSAILKDKLILLVEDNEMNRLVATTVLDHYGAVVDQATNGAESLNMLRKKKYDLVLMDVQMPVMDGLEATREIRREFGDTTPVIALTANAIKGESDKCSAAGMNDYLSKPFEEEDLIRMIAHWLEIRIPSQPSQPTVIQQAIVMPLYDLCKLRELSRGNDDFVATMVKMFLQQVPAAVKEINTAYNCRNLNVVKAIAHRIRPVLDNLCIASLKNEMKEMERLALYNEPSDRLQELIQQLTHTIEKVVGGLELEMGPPSNIQVCVFERCASSFNVDKL